MGVRWEKPSLIKPLEAALTAELSYERGQAAGPG